MSLTAQENSNLLNGIFIVEQKFYILLVILVSIGSFIYFRNRYEDSSNIDLILFILGLFSVVTGIVFVYLIHGYRILIECIFLQTGFISGKLIIMGYIFLLKFPKKSSCRHAE